MIIYDKVLETFKTITKMRKLSDNQFDGIKYFIILSKPEVGKLIRKIILYMMDNSKNLTEPVCLTIRESEQLSANEIENLSREFSSFLALGAGTMLNEIIKLTGSNFKFSRHFGFLDEKGLNIKNQFSTKAGDGKTVYTFWLSLNDYDQKATNLVFDLEKIKATKLTIKDLESVAGDLIET